MTKAFLARLGLKYPIVQAPMAGTSSPALVAAVCKAGGLGSFGHAYTQPADMLKEVAWVREQVGDVPMHINLFVQAPPLAQTPADVAAAANAIKPWFEKHNLPLPQQCEPPYAPDFSAQIEAAFKARPKVLSSHLNPFSKDVIRDAKALGIAVAGSATNVGEALELQALGVDFVIAQSGEAGGHRGTWQGEAADNMVGTLSLVRLMKARLQVPIVAAGGIMDGAGIAAVMMLGASAAQLGTAFLDTDEALTNAPHRNSLTAHPQGNSVTAVTTAFSGRPAQSVRNAYMEDARKAQREGKWAQLAFPAQSRLTLPVRTASAKAESGDAVQLWAGHAHALSRKASAGDLVELLANETRKAVSQATELLFE